MRYNILILLIIVVISSCIGQTDQIEKERQGEKIPIWNVSDIKYMQLEKDKPVYVYTMTINKRPPFYKGAMPVIYEAIYPPWGIQEYPLIYDFKDFKNYFIYHGTILVGARTYNQDGDTILAEMRLNYSITNDGEQYIIAEEFHYNNGKLIFKTKSEIDVYEGVKRKEIEKIGNKIRDYYFIVPAGIMK